MENIENTPATPEGIWVILNRISLSIEESRADSERHRKAFEQEMAASRGERKESEARFEREIATSRAEFDSRMKNLDEMIGGVSNSNGMAAEELFYNTLDNGDKKIFGEQFTMCYRNLFFHDKSRKKKNEFDIVLVNGKSMAIVEVKYKARKEDIQKIIEKIPDFKLCFPQYKDHRVYLGLAAMSFDRGAEKQCTDHGIAVVKQVDDAVLINDKHLKIY